MFKLAILVATLTLAGYAAFQYFGGGGARITGSARDANQVLEGAGP